MKVHHIIMHCQWLTKNPGFSLKGLRVALDHSTCGHFPLMWSRECTKYLLICIHDLKWVNWVCPSYQNGNMPGRDLWCNPCPVYHDRGSFLQCNNTKGRLECTLHADMYCSVFTLTLTHFLCVKSSSQTVGHEQARLLHTYTAATSPPTIMHTCGHWSTSVKPCNCGVTIIICTVIILDINSNLCDIIAVGASLSTTVLFFL